MNWILFTKFKLRKLTVKTQIKGRVKVKLRACIQNNLIECCTGKNSTNKAI
jgi:hypothetical protein